MLTILPFLALAATALAAPAAEQPAPALTVPAAPPSAPPAATSSSVPNPSQVTINSISYGGTGCPQGSVGSFISADRLTFTLIFDSFVASIGPGVPVTASRINCQLNINLQYPSGFQYSVLGTDFRGYAGLDAGITGVQSANYYFSGSQAQAATSTTFKGPMSGDYLISDKIPFTSTIWSPCGAALPLNVNSQVRLTSSKSAASGLMTQDSIDGKVTFVVGVQWQAWQSINCFLDSVDCFARPDKGGGLWWTWQCCKDRLSGWSLRGGL
ncbi:secreted protein [Amylocarpus encephaloides]|uniref:Secreted protein n=1 Tax=Amylocarpus encephaloides TaxID=45428 RepID=A0A9P8BZM3_9HELO|nr:secreted protein [Amylocarpus encephaloides]